MDKLENLQFQLNFWPILALALKLFDRQTRNSSLNKSGLEPEILPETTSKERLDVLTFVALRSTQLVLKLAVVALFALTAAVLDDELLLLLLEDLLCSLSFLVTNCRILRRSSIHNTMEDRSRNFRL